MKKEKKGKVNSSMKKGKKLRVVAVGLVLAMVLGTAAAAVGTMINISVNPGVKISVDGKEATPVNQAGDKQDSFIYNNSTYVPLR